MGPGAKCKNSGRTPTYGSEEIERLNPTITTAKRRRSNWRLHGAFLLSGGLRHPGQRDEAFPVKGREVGGHYALSEIPNYAGPTCALYPPSAILGVIAASQVSHDVSDGMKRGSLTTT